MLAVFLPTLSLNYMFKSVCQIFKLFNSSKSSKSLNSFSLNSDTIAMYLVPSNSSAIEGVSSWPIEESKLAIDRYPCVEFESKMIEKTPFYLFIAAL